MSEQYFKLRMHAYIRSKCNPQGEASTKCGDLKDWINNKKEGLFAPTEEFAGYENLTPQQKKDIPQLPIGLTTCRNWLHRLGYRWKRVGKGYFDGHERPDVIRWRQLFCQRLAHLWPRINNWFYLTIDEARDYGISLYDIGAYTVQTVNGPRVELVKDLWGWLWDKGHVPTKKHDCHEKEIIILFQDESIYKAYQAELHAWLLHKKAVKLPKKGDGAGIMVSGVICDVHGFMVLTSEQVLAFTLKRMGRLNADGTRERLYLTEVELEDGTKGLTSYYLFKYGKGRDGYWTGEMMARQIDQIMDMFEILHPGKSV